MMNHFGLKINTHKFGLKLNIGQELVDSCKRAIEISLNKLDHPTYLPANRLVIGTWERNSERASHLVVKVYYNKKKIVWEILDGELKNKIESCWDNIIGFKLTNGSHQDQPDSLEIELANPPSFYGENKLEARKHSKWHLQTDFTENNAASTYRRHYAEFSPGVLDKDYGMLFGPDGPFYGKSLPSLSPHFFDFPIGYLPDFREQNGYNQLTVNSQPVPNVVSMHHEERRNYQIMAENNNIGFPMGCERDFNYIQEPLLRIPAQNVVSSITAPNNESMMHPALNMELMCEETISRNHRTMTRNNNIVIPRENEDFNNILQIPLMKNADESITLSNQSVLFSGRSSVSLSNTEENDHHVRGWIYDEEIKNQQLAATHNNNVTFPGGHEENFDDVQSPVKQYSSEEIIDEDFANFLDSYLQGYTEDECNKANQPHLPS